MMDNAREYCSYDPYHMMYDLQTHTFDMYYKKTPFVTGMGVVSTNLADFSKVEVIHTPQKQDNVTLTIKYYQNADNIALVLTFSVGYAGVRVTAQTPENDVVKLRGSVCVDADYFDDTFPVSFKQNAGSLNCGTGNSASTADHALYNRKTDFATILGNPHQTNITRDDNNRHYTFETIIFENNTWNGATISCVEDVLANQYHIPFSPMNRNATFSAVPVGWMTWYAVKFNACEEKVLANAKWQAENLKDYGANAVWVDWEWYHCDMAGERSDGVNSLQPDLKKYPHGMKHLADKIKELGLIPALWLGFTNEPGKNEFIEQHPDMVLVEQKTWCGKYYFDLSHPDYLNKYLPAALNNVHKWGYEAVKYDTLPICLSTHEKNHEKMYAPSLTTREAYRNMIAKTREILGKNMYMLSCSGSTNASVLWASDLFDAARIGDDIFTWEEHLVNVKRIAEFYPLHNIQFHVDADNVVLRDEFNNFEQAKARVAVISLLGLPMTFGDEFSVLSEEKLQLLKKSLPILDIHPTDLCPAVLNDESLLINLKIDKDYDCYQVTGAFNLTDRNTSRFVNISKDLNLENADYLVYDFYRDEYLGQTNTGIQLDFLPFECRILSLRPYKGVPQVISTSRHISQGAAEIVRMEYSGEALNLRANLIKGEDYTVTVYVPENYTLKEYTGFNRHESTNTILRFSYLPMQTGTYDFQVVFEKV